MPQDPGRKERKGKHDSCYNQQRVNQRLAVHGFSQHNAGEISSFEMAVNQRVSDWLILEAAAGYEFI